MRYSVLIVDDDEDDRNLFRYGFEQNKIGDVGVFNDAYDVLYYLSSVATVLPKLIVSDFNMPTLSGLELLQSLKKSDLLKTIPFIIFSTYTPVTQVAKCMQSGALGYHQKPSSLEEVVKVVKQIIQPIFAEKQ